MRAASIVSFLLIATLSAQAAVTDQALRYVNSEIVTMSDVMLRIAIRRQDYLRQGKPQPLSPEERTAFNQDSLEQLTDEILMVQKAKELKLIPDHDRVVLDVLERAKELGQGLSLADQTHARRERERQQSIDYLLNYFYDPRTPEATPAELWATYQSRQSEFRRPARARVLTILLRPSDPSLAKDLRRAKADLFKRAQAATDAQVSQAATARLDEYLADGTTPESRDRLLDDCIQELATAAAREDLDDKSRDIARAAREILTQAATIRDLDQTAHELEAQRAQLAGQGEEAFTAAARRISQGPNATEGGAQGWVEPGIFPAEVDQRIFSLPPGTVSEVFVANQAAWLVFVQEREDARVRSFDEVAGELEAVQRRQRRETLRAKVVGILRLKAAITDVAPVSSISDGP